MILAKDTPEIKILRHVDLLEDIHESLFFGRPFYFVVEADGDDIGAFTMIKIVSSKKSHH